MNISISLFFYITKSLLINIPVRIRVILFNTLVIHLFYIIEYFMNLCIEKMCCSQKVLSINKDLFIKQNLF